VKKLEEGLEKVLGCPDGRHAADRLRRPGGIGGSCVVLPCTTAAGTIFQISGTKQISIMRNGSFYNTDAGVEPDFRLDKAESYYDRPALAEYLNNLK